jgi:hypothetical protein
MKLSILLIAIMMVTAVGAQSQGVGSIDNECQENGFDFGIVKFEWIEGSFVPEDPEVLPWSINVTGNAQTADWVADPAVAGVISKEATNSYVHAGGTSGTISKTGQFDISHLTFCANEPDNEIPEFSVIGALAVLGLAGLYITRKRN